ncbi:HEAT repeat domain-containing protein [Larkinella rosea]|uniref:HEAT repeat domain-containing protein n=1 Tax=Larkinella rosea TaxID=2025312 RepID=A0A3P1BAG3_9BACT|nr:HEAT repeat domain-containing protein [Larkinella rosea]RRA98025.1 HEAT repeat domain-containing protein [Larkinella rosea]
MTNLTKPFASAQPVSDALRSQCLQELRTVLRTEQEWIKVHAAEYLLWIGEPAGVQDVYLDELQKFSTKAPYRIGIWRVLAQAATTPDEKEKWTDPIAAAFKDPNGPDRIHAAETLAKLGISPTTVDAEAARKAISGENRPLSLYTLWGATLSDAKTAPANRRKFLDLALNRQEEVAPRKLGTFITRRLGGLTAAEWKQLAEAALSEPVSSAVQLNLVHAALVTASTEATRSEPYRLLRIKMLAAQQSPAVGDQLELVAALAETGLPVDVAVLTPLLKHENADVRAGAAYAILKIGTKKG